MSCFRKFKKSRAASKHPVSLANSTHDFTTDPPHFNADSALDTNPEGRYSLTPLPVRKPVNEGTSKTTTTTSTPSDGGDVVEPRRERGSPSCDQNVQIGQNVLGPHSTGGKSHTRNQEECGRQGTPVQEPPKLAPESTSHRLVSSPLADNIGNNKGEIRPADSPKFAKQTDKGTLPGDPRRAVEGFGPLKVVLSDILAAYADREGIIAVENSIKKFLPRVVTLEEHFDSRPGDVAEHRRREELICKLKGVEGQLRSFCDKWGLQQPPDRTQDHEAVLSLFENLQEAMYHYQVMQRKAINDRELKRIVRRSHLYLDKRNDISWQDPAEAVVINSFRCAKQAEYRHGDRNHCLKGTRREILDEIQSWTRDFTKSPIYWLNGLAGTGKTTIAQTIAEKLFADGRLGASFFCSRDFEDRRDLKFILPTLAVQLARTYADFRSIFVRLVQLDPEIADESLCDQMEKLVVQPLAESDISTVIMIDALDECRDEGRASAVLSVLGQFVARIPKVKFFLTSRPETHIREGIRLPPLVKATDVFVLHEVEPDKVNDDVRLLFTHNFSGPGSGRPDGWPTEEQLDVLCKRAAGLFVHAMAAIRFINQANKNPKRQLDRLLQSPESSAFEGKTKFKGNATIDSLYLSILQEAFDDDDPEHDLRVRSVLGAVILAANPLSPTAIAALLGFDTDDVFPPLRSVHSLLVFQEAAHCPIRPFHKSFPDFITDPARCINPRFRVCPPDQHAELLAGCLELMNRRLERNICKLPDGVMNSEVSDLEDRIGRHVDQALQYACKSWHKHLVDTVPVHIIPVLHHFLEKNFLFWLEVLSVLGSAREAVDALRVVTKLLDSRDSPTLNLVKDYLRFVIAFFEVISTSAPHIYHSALPLSPRTSIVHETYEQYAHPLGRVVQGLPISWKENATTVYDEEFEGEVAWSPCDKFIAVAKTRAVEVLDAVTLKRISRFESPTNPTASLLSFSSDSRYLTQIGDGRLTRWDLQTGDPLDAILSGPDASPMIPFSSTYSVDGRAVAVAWRTRPDNDTFITTYNLISMTYTRSYHPPGTRIITPIWTHGECLRFATVKLGSIAVWEAQFTSTGEPAEVQSFPARDEIADGEYFLFLPALSRLAFTLRGTISVWDVKKSKLLLELGSAQDSQGAQTPSPPRFSSGSSFSSDGRFFACMTVGREVYVWKERGLRYILHQQLQFATAIVRARPLFSPSGESIIASIRPTIHLWSTQDRILSSDPEIWSQENFSLTLSPNKTLAAFTWKQRRTVTILDLESREPRLIINTDGEVLCLGMTDDTVVVVLREEIVTWKIPTEKCTLDSRANIKDSVRTTRLCEISARRIPYASLSPDLSRGVILAIPRHSPSCYYPLVIFDVPTGSRVTSFLTFLVEPFLTRGGRQLWGVRGSSVEGWEIGSDSEDYYGEPKRLTSSKCPPNVFPWRSSRGYKVTGDGWVLSPTQKRLLWLPHDWRSFERDRMWSGRFLGLLYRGLPEVVILEFLD